MNSGRLTFYAFLTRPNFTCIELSTRPYSHIWQELYRWIPTSRL